jgi:hypothetical protein
LLELTALPSIVPALWLQALEEADALLVGGGDCQYLSYWIHASGVAARLPVLLDRLVYVGLSAGSMILTRYGTTYGHHILPPDTPQCLGLLDCAIHPHLDYPAFPDNAMAKLEALAATLPVPSYLIDDQTGLLVLPVTITRECFTATTSFSDSNGRAQHSALPLCKNPRTVTTGSSRPEQPLSKDSKEGSNYDSSEHSA